jgi:hypothetical protein
MQDPVIIGIMSAADTVVTVAAPTATGSKIIPAPAELPKAFDCVESKTDAINWAPCLIRPPALGRAPFKTIANSIEKMPATTSSSTSVKPRRFISQPARQSW